MYVLEADGLEHPILSNTNVGNWKPPLISVGKSLPRSYYNDTNDLQDERKRSFKRNTLLGIGQVGLWNVFVTVSYKMYMVKKMFLSVTCVDLIIFYF